MAYRRSTNEAAALRKARRDRELASPRLRDSVPRLRTLHFEVTVQQGGAWLNAARHVKRIAVDHAPALFLIPCTDPDCSDGGHDLTEAVLRSLERGRTRFSAENRCSGKVGDRECGRVVNVAAFAAYSPREGGTRG
jgi:hypothetical protein